MATSRTADELLSIIRRALTEVAPDADLGTVGPDDDIVEALELDSMDVLNVMAAVADATGLEVPERDYGRTRTMEGFVDELVKLEGG
jgi:acyl carrier protein